MNDKQYIEMNIYDESLPPDEEQKWLKIERIVVKDEDDKKQLLLASRYIHDLDCIDTDFLPVNAIAHLYQSEDLIIVSSNKNTLEVPTELVQEILELQGAECRYDHHGYCQEHNLQMKDECWVYRLNKLLTDNS